MSFQKLGHKVNSKKNHMFTLDGIDLIQSSGNFVTILIFIAIYARLKMGHIGSKSSSLGQF